MEVLLSNCGNPDHGQSPFSEVYGTSSGNWVKVRTFKKASELCRKYIDKYNLGGGNWIGGQIRDKSGIIAHVSYNGRVWEGEKYVVGKTKEIII